MPDEEKRGQAGVNRVLVMWPGSDGQTFWIEIDATTREVHSQTNLVTDHAVETGANVSDHIRPQPDTLSLDGFISNSPQYLPKDHVGGATLTERQIDVQIPGVTPAVQIFGQPIIGRQAAFHIRGFKVQEFSNEFDRVQEVYDEFRSLREAGTLLQIKTRLRFYTDMAITSLEATRQGGDSDGLRFSLELKQIRFGVTKQEAVPALPTKRKSKGTVTPKPSTDLKANKDAEESILYNLGNTTPL
jgi:hypothetical protein